VLLLGYMNKVWKFIISISLPQIASGIGALFTTSKIPTWYSTLEKPLLNPPSFIFGPVWTTLYLLMGVAFYLVWIKGFDHAKVKLATSLFMFQLVLNSLWSWFFFGMENPGLALIDIVLLWISIVGTIVVFARVNKKAGWLLAPYLIWVSFATYLNYSIYVLN